MFLSAHGGVLAIVPLFWAGLAAIAASRALCCGAPVGRWWWLVAVVCAGAARAAAAEDPLRSAAPWRADDRQAEQIDGLVERVEDRPGGARSFRLRAVGPDAALWVTVHAAAGRLPALLPGDRVRVRGRVRAPRGYLVEGGFDARELARRRGVVGLLHATPRDVQLVQAGAAGSPWRWPARLQRSWSAAIAARGGSAAGNALVRALVTGDRSGLERSLEEDFRRAGVTHVLSVSGLHLACVAGLLFLLLRWLVALWPALALRVEPARAAALGAAPAAIAYAAVTGGAAATARALLVALVGLVAVLRCRRMNLADALGAAALLFLASAPETLWDPSSQLSFAATAALGLCLAPARASAPATGTVAGRLARVAGRWVWTGLGAALATTAATAPLLAWHFGELSLAGPLCNLLVVPLLELAVLPAALAGSALAPSWGAGGGAVLDVAIALAGAVAQLVGQVAAVAPRVTLPPPRPAEWLLWLALAAGAAAWRTGLLSRRAGFLATGSCALALALSLAWSRWVAPSARRELRVAFLDVGQGDAAVVEVPGGPVWLVDAGGRPFAGAGSAAERRWHGEEPGRNALLRYLRARRIHRIDLVVLSHPHPDHYAGLGALLGEIEIGELWAARPAAPVHPNYAALVAALQRTGARLVAPPLGVARRSGGAALEVLAPGRPGRPAEVDPVLGVNDSSLVVLLRYAGRRLLFTGDLEAEGEASLLASAGAAVRADVVKVPHHGSRTSSTPAFVAATAAGAAIVSCGPGNQFGFPAPAVLARWQESGARVWRTDLHGQVTVTVSPGGGIEVQPRVALP